MELSTRTRRALSTALAIILAAETVTAVAAAAATRTVTHELPAAPPAGAVLAAEADAVRTQPEIGTAPSSRLAQRIVELPDPAAPGVTGQAALVPDSLIERARQAASASDRRPAVEDTAVKVKPGRADGSSSPGAATTARDASPDGRPAYRGTNHVWIPALGISKSVRWFPCERTRPPDNYMYRWGCAGANNVYLMGHAYSVMEPLHDAYVSGRLSKGMKAWYADPNGRVRVYAVRWWKVVRPTTDAAWAWAPQDTPSMTLQTCVGRNSEFRLMVRLTEVGG